MNSFHVTLTETAIADLKGISKEIRDQIPQDLKALESVPFPSGTNIKRLKAFRPPVYHSIWSNLSRLLYFSLLLSTKSQT
jgi:hypothetical protein